MMDVIADVECLYLEDNPQDRASYTELIRILWNKHSPNIPIRITPVESTDEAIKQIRENPGKFHLLIADLLFGSQDDKKGLIAIQVARQLDPDL